MSVAVTGSASFVRLSKQMDLDRLAEAFDRNETACELDFGEFSSKRHELLACDNSDTELLGVSIEFNS